jgi:hypothetical protein
MPRNDPHDLQPPMKYKERRIARPLSKGEIEAAADRAETGAMRTPLTDNRANLSAVKPAWDC